MTDAKSKFFGFIDATASAENRRPNIKGELARADGQLHSFALWGGPKKDGSGIYLKGTVQSKNITSALTTQITEAADIEQPAGLTLKVGEIVLFENDKADKDGVVNEKRPDFYGYSRTAEGINRHSAWGAVGTDGGLQLRGTTEAWTPNATVEAKTDAPTKPEPTTKAKVRQALSAKR